MDDTSEILSAIHARRAVRAFQPVEISAHVREQLLNAARAAPSSFNIQPYRLYWVESQAKREAAARLCMSQPPALTATVLVVAVADIGSWAATSQSHLDWLRETGCDEARFSRQQKKAGFAKWFFAQGWFGSFGLMKWFALRLANLGMTIGMPPVSRQGLFKWATKSTALACANLMIAAEALGLQTCPMEGFDNRRLADFLKLSRKHHEIVMVIAIGRKSADHVDQPQWRRSLDATVTIL